MSYSERVRAVIPLKSIRYVDSELKGKGDKIAGKRDYEERWGIVSRYSPERMQLIM